MLLSWHDFPNSNLATPLTFLIPFGISTDLKFHKSCCQKRTIITHECHWCVLENTQTQYKCVLIPYNSTFLGAGTRGRQSLLIDAEALWTRSIHSNLVCPYSFEDSFPIYSSLVIRLSQWSMFHQHFFPVLFQTMYQCYFGKYTLHEVLNYFFQLMF